MVVFLGRGVSLESGVRGRGQGRLGSGGETGRTASGLLAIGAGVYVHLYIIPYDPG